MTVDRYISETSELRSYMCVCFLFVIMVVIMLSPSRPLCFAADVDIFLSFFAAWSPNFRSRSVDRYQTSQHVRHWPTFINVGRKVGALPEKNWRPETLKLRDFIETISGIEKDIVKWQTALRTVITPAYIVVINVYKRFFYFSIKTRF